jgi:hypothetical protein
MRISRLTIKNNYQSPQLEVATIIQMTGGLSSHPTGVNTTALIPRAKKSHLAKMIHAQVEVQVKILVLRVFFHGTLFA